MLHQAEPLEWYPLARRFIFDSVYGFADDFEDGIWSDNWEQNNFLTTGLGTVEESDGVIRTHTGDGDRDGIQTKRRYKDVEVNIRALTSDSNSILVFHFSHDNTIEFIVDDIHGVKNMWKIVKGMGIG